MGVGDLMKAEARLWLDTGDLGSVPDLVIPDEMVDRVRRIDAEVRRLQTVEPDGKYRMTPLDVLD